VIFLSVPITSCRDLTTGSAVLLEFPEEACVAAEDLTADDIPDPVAISVLLLDEAFACPAPPFNLVESALGSSRLPYVVLFPSLKAYELWPP
jgi:hypothetical protein